MSIEGFTCLLVFKNLFSFALTFKGFDWIIEADDYKKVFVAIGTVQVVICALTVPMCKSCSLSEPSFGPMSQSSLFSRRVADSSFRHFRQEEPQLLLETQRLLQGDGLGG